VDLLVRNSSEIDIHNSDNWDIGGNHIAIGSHATGHGIFFTSNLLNPSLGNGLNVLNGFKDFLNKNRVDLQNAVTFDATDMRCLFQLQKYADFIGT
jgi:hypothetical protein